MVVIMRYIVLFIFLFRAAFSLQSQQLPIGSWRTHSSYYNSIAVARSDKEIFSASKEGLFAWDRQESSLQFLSKVNRLNDAQIGQIAYDETNKTLVIGYRNGNIDLLTKKGTKNISNVLKTSFQDKRIHEILVHNSTAYIGTSFGLLILDIVKQEITDNFIRQSNLMTVYDLTIQNQKIYLATSQGLFYFELSQQNNIQDFANWKRVNETASLAPILKIGSLQDGLFFFSGATKKIYNRKSNNNTPLNVLADGASCYDITQSNSDILLASDKRIIRYSNTGTVSEIQNKLIVKPLEINSSNSSSIWVSDEKSGLLEIQNGKVTQINGQGIFGYAHQNLEVEDNKIWAISGGFDLDNYNALNKEGFISSFESNKWSNQTFGVNYSQLPQLQSLSNITDVVSVQNIVYVSTFGQGLYRLSMENNTLTKIKLPKLPKNNFFITSLSKDSSDNIWITAHKLDNAQASVFTINPQLQVSEYSFSQVRGSRFPLKLFTDSQKNHWVVLSPNIRGGLFVLQEDGQVRQFTASSDLPDIRVNCITEDNKNQIWIGTNNGVALLRVSSDYGNASFALPRVEGVPLLKGVKVNTVAVDGANHVWFGTDNGLFSVDSSGERQTQFFSQSNSPLPSDKILDIAIQRLTGEVFILTDKGLISYQSQNTQGEEEYNSIVVYPNPVPPSYKGDIAISGLIDNSWIKITDSSGGLVREGLVEGGTFTWDGKDAFGQNVSTGIYLVFLVAADGKRAGVGKIAVVR